MIDGAIAGDSLEGREGINPFDFWQGADFKLRAKKVAGYPNYDSSEFLTPGVLDDLDDDQLESIWASDLGDRYWALVRSGIQKEPLTPVEEQKKHAATQKLNPSVGGGFGTPGAVNAVLVAMTLFEPGTMRIDTPEQKLPGWLLANYQQIFAEPLSQQV